LRERFANLLNSIKLRYDLRLLVKEADKDADLEMGSFLISRLGTDPSVFPEDFSRRLDELAEPLMDRVKRIQKHRKKLRVFLDYVYRELDFRGNARDYYDPRNSFLTELLDSRTGIPVSLSVLCLLLARRAGLPLQGINLPGHFILKYDSPEYSTYIDPYNEGNLLSREECLQFVARQGLEQDVSYLNPASNLGILKRMYRNLINLYSVRGDRAMAGQLRRHLNILEKSSINR